MVTIEQLAVELERDEAQEALRDLAAAVDKANKVYLDEHDRLRKEVDMWKASHEGQWRNTQAFMNDAEVYESRAKEAELVVANLYLEISRRDKMINELQDELKWLRSK